MALVASNFEATQRPKAYGLVASAGAIAVAAGPLIGGARTTYPTWRVVFAGEVLVVLVILVLTRKIQDSEVRSRPSWTWSESYCRPPAWASPSSGCCDPAGRGWVLPKPDAPSMLGISADSVVDSGWALDHQGASSCGSNG